MRCFVVLKFWSFLNASEPGSIDPGSKMHMFIDVCKLCFVYTHLLLSQCAVGMKYAEDMCILLANDASVQRECLR